MSLVHEKTSGLDIKKFATQMNLVWEDVVFFINQINSHSNEDACLKVADIGSCNGDMSRFLRRYIAKDIYTYNVDIYEPLNDIAKIRDTECGLVNNVEYALGDALRLPFEQESLDVLIYSRIFHEIFSYEPDIAKNGFSNTSVFKALQQAKKCLKKNGIILIQDPAKPAEYNSKVCMSNFAQPKKVLNETDLLNTDVSVLGTEDLLRRFLIEFEPVAGQYKVTPKGYVFDKWIASEFIRHRKFNDSQSHWNKEICELYGPLSIFDYKYIAKTLGFKVKSAQYVRFKKANNFYAINNEFDITQNGKKLSQYRSFPVSMYIVLQK